MMVKQTQKMMLIAAALLLLLLAFGLGFYTYPLVTSLDNSRAGREPVPAAEVGAGSTTGVTTSAAGSEGADADLSADSPQTASSQSGDHSAEEAALASSQEGAQSQAGNGQSGVDAVDENEVALRELDLSGVEAVDLEIFLDAYRALERDFFGGRPESRQQIYGAIRGLLQSYDDPYTFFIEPETNEVEQGNLRGSFGGIGAHVQPSELGFVLDPIRDNPAQKAGIETGDYLVQVDETEITKDTPVDDVVALIRGPLDTDVVLGLVRPDDLEDLSEASLADAQSLTITVTRAEIRTPSVDWRIITGDEIPVDLMLERLRPEEAGDPEGSSEESEESDEATGDTTTEGELPAGLTESDIEAWTSIRIGYIQHRIYSDRSPGEMRTAIDELLADGADRFIVDLRGNPGGPVTSVVKVTDLWTDEPLIMFEEKADGARRDFEAAEDTLVGDELLIIVVDGGTASASEIFAGALRDHGKALILGEKTFGKGSVQVIHVLPDSSSMHITNARWFTPDGNKIDGTGLLPDIEVEPGSDSLQEAILQILDIVN